MPDMALFDDDALEVPTALTPIDGGFLPLAEAAAPAGLPPEPAPGAARRAPSPTSLALFLTIRVERSRTRRICRSCRHRRVLFAVAARFGLPGGVPGGVLVGASDELCSSCAGLLIHGGRRAG